MGPHSRIQRALTIASPLLAILIAPASAQLKKTATMWVEVVDSIITPGEAIEFTLWMGFDPPAPAVIPAYTGGPPAEIAGFGQVFGMDFVANAANGVGGTWEEVWWNDAFSNFSFINQKTPFMLDYIRLDNYLPYFSTMATNDNPLWLLKGKWRPFSYDETTVQVGPVIPAVYIAGYLLPKPPNPYPGFGVLYKTHINFTLVQIKPLPCASDCDNTGGLTIDDFICFQTLYAIGDPKADCDGDGQLLIDDFICFQTAYAIGC